MEMDRLNLGCGPNAPSSWLNLDGSWNAWLYNHGGIRWALATLGVINRDQGSQWSVRPIIHDLRRPLPFREDTLSAVYASHILEHLYLVDARRLLTECRRVLKPNGVIRIIVPDLRFMVTEYLAKKNDSGRALSEKIRAADYLNERLAFRKPAPPGGNLLLRFYETWKDLHSHYWMYDSDSLACYVEQAGFAEVAEKGFLQSAIQGIKEVEDPERILGGAGICIEAKKP